MNIYVGNLSYEVSGDDLKLAFEAFGQVEKATVIRDKFSGDSKGFGFVEMPNKVEAEAAMQGVGEIKGRAIVANEARPPAKKSFTPQRRGGSGKFDSRRRESKY